MSGKSGGGGGAGQYFKRADGKLVALHGDTYAQAQNLSKRINSSDISSLDRAELLGQTNDALANNKDLSPNGPFASDSATHVFTHTRQELADAIAGIKPKYKYRKYLDSITALQNDQPGQLQTVLSRGGSGTILGGGTL